MVNRILDVGSTVTVLGLNIYTIIEILKSSFPILLACSSLILTIVMIMVQLKKNKLIKEEFKTKELECAKIALEIEDLKRHKEDDLSNG